MTLRPQMIMTEDVMELYLSSFPAEERRPLHHLSRLLADPREPVTLYRADIEGVFAAFLTLWRLPSGVAYVEHFAVSHALRGQGIGSAVVARLPELTDGAPAVLEVERPLTEEARRRIDFYRRGGLVLHDYDYLQPPYSKTLSPLKMRLMTLGDLGSTPIDALVKELHRAVYHYPD